MIDTLHRNNTQYSTILYTCITYDTQTEMYILSTLTLATTIRKKQKTPSSYMLYPAVHPRNIWKHFFTLYFPKKLGRNVKHSSWIVFYTNLSNLPGLPWTCQSVNPTYTQLQSKLPFTLGIIPAVGPNPFSKNETMIHWLWGGERYSQYQVLFMEIMLTSFLELGNLVTIFVISTVFWGVTVEGSISFSATSMLNPVETLSLTWKHLEKYWKNDKTHIGPKKDAKPKTDQLVFLGPAAGFLGTLNAACTSDFRSFIDRTSG